MVKLAKGRDLFVGAWFLAAELSSQVRKALHQGFAFSLSICYRATHLIAREPKDNKPLVLMLLVQLLEACVLRCEATIKGLLDSFKK